MIDFQDRVADDFARGIAGWKRRRRAKAGLATAAAVFVLAGGWLNFVVGPMINETRTDQIVADLGASEPTSTPEQDQDELADDVELSTEAASPPDIPSPVDGDGRDASVESLSESEPVEGRGARFINGAPSTDAPAAGGESSGGDAAEGADGSEESADDEADGDETVGDEGDGLEVDGDETDRAAVDPSAIDFEISSASFEGTSESIDAIIGFTHEPACLEARFNAGDAALSYAVAVIDRDCAAGVETTWSRLPLGALDPGVHELRLDETRWPFVVEESVAEDDDEDEEPSAPARELMLDEVAIEYAKYRDDWERNQARPGSYLDTIVTVRTQVPDDCHELVVDTDEGLHVATVRAERVSGECVSTTGETELTHEFVLPHPSGELGTWIATINGAEIPFEIGDRSLDSLSDLTLRRDPAGTQLVPSSPGQYALTWEQRSDGCSTHTFGADPAVSGAYLSERFFRPPGPNPPDENPPPFGCPVTFPVVVSVGLGSDRPGDLQPVTINGTTFTPYELRLDPTFVAADPGAGVPSATDFTVFDSRTGASLGRLNADFGVGWVRSQPVQVRLESPEQKVCRWQGEVNVGDSPDVVAISLIETCEPGEQDQFVDAVLDDVDIEYAKYRDDWEREQANPGSYLDTIVTVRAEVPNNCYELTAETMERHVATVRAELVDDTCIPTGSFVDRSLEFVLPHPSGERGPWVATINGTEVPFTIGDYRLERFFLSTMRIERDPTAIELVSVSPGDYALVWDQYVDPCTTPTFASDPSQPGAYVSARYVSPVPPGVPGQPQLGCGPGARTVAVGLGTGRGSDLAAITINGEVFTPVPVRFEQEGLELDLGPFDPRFELPENFPAATEFNVIDTSDLGYRPLGALDAEWGFVWLKGAEPARIMLKAATDDPRCSWFDVAVIDPNEDVIPVKNFLACS